EERLLAELDSIAVEAVGAAGPGAWVERKPTSVVIHVREAEPALGAAAIAAARTRQARLHGHECHEGSNVLELMARPADKGRGLTALRSEFRPVATVYVGDDVPDEDAFAVLDVGDVSIKVGAGSTVATHRLPDAGAVADALRRLAAGLAAPSGDIRSEQR
ncbi:MAG: trehalose-phosphatase, partial [Ilumatobacter sp.]